MAELGSGFDPTCSTSPISAEEWASEFAKGAALGDPGGGTTILYLLGSLSSSGGSFIPRWSRWIVGAVLDLRDAGGQVIKGKWVGAGSECPPRGGVAAVRDRSSGPLVPQPLPPGADSADHS